MPPDSEQNPVKTEEDSFEKTELKRAFAARDKAKAEKRELQKLLEDSTTAEKVELQSQLKDAMALLQDYQAKEKAAEDEKKKAAGKFDELTAQLQGDFAKRLGEKEELIKSLQAAEQQRVKKDRMSALIEGIQSKVKVETPVLRGLLLDAETRGMDVSPESLDEDTIADVIGRLRGDAPSAFQPKDLGVSPGSAQSAGRSDLQKAIDSLNAVSRYGMRKRGQGR